jgi:drug/metabolite transporter superfamily protein YnfA
MAGITWFLVDWMISSKREVWVLISALFLTAVLALVTVFALVLFGSSGAAGSGLIFVLAAGIWSSVRSYRKPNNDNRKSISITLDKQDENFSYDDEEIQKRREKAKSKIIPKN